MTEAFLHYHTTTLFCFPLSLSLLLPPICHSPHPSGVVRKSVLNRWGVAGGMLLSQSG